MAFGVLRCSKPPRVGVASVAKQSSQEEMRSAGIGCGPAVAGMAVDEEDGCVAAVHIDFQMAHGPTARPEARFLARPKHVPARWPSCPCWPQLIFLTLLTNVFAEFHNFCIVKGVALVSFVWIWM
jgi:hypothetical protein